jgi:hypothetical protein
VTSSGPRGRFDRFWLLLALLPPLLLLPNLGAAFLWQDEAETALLAERVLLHGVPLADDGVGPVITDQPGRADVDARGLWIWTPWLDKYTAALGLGLAGRSAFAARLPFALVGWLGLFLVYAALRDVTRQRGLARLATLFLLLSVWFLLYQRQCRYYAFLAPFTLLHAWGYVRLLRGRAGGVELLVAGGLGLYHTFLPQLVASSLATGLHALAGRRDVLPRFALAHGAVAALCLPFFVYTEGWSRNYEGLGYGFESPGRYLSSLRAYLVLVHAYGFPFALALGALGAVGAAHAPRRPALRAGAAAIAVAWCLAAVARPSPASFAAFVAASTALAGLGAWLLRREATGDWGGPLAAIAAASVLLSAAFAPFPFFRYLLGVLPLLALASAALLLRLAAGRRAAVAAGALLLVATDLLHVGPLQAADAVLRAVGVGVEPRNTDVAFLGHMPSNGVVKAVVGQWGSEPRPHLPLREYAHELLHDYDGPLEGVGRYLADHAAPGERIATTYEHFTLQFHTELRVLRDWEVEAADLPEWILQHSPRPPRFAPEVVDALRARYRRAPVDAAELPWENIPEPYWHQFRTRTKGARVTLLRRSDA